MRKEERFKLYLYLFFILFIGFCVYSQLHSQSHFTEQMTTINDNVLISQFEKQIARLENLINKLNNIQTTLNS